MSGRDIALLAFLCLIWGANLSMTRWVTSDVPPLFAATLRFAATVACLLPYLRRLPPQPGRVALVGLCMGGLHFGLQYAGVAMAPASSAAIVAQLGVPFTVLLSVIFLGETLGPRRTAGTLLAVGGVTLIIYDPAQAGVSPGLVLVAGSALAVSVGTVHMKRLVAVRPLELQAWTGVVSALPLALASAAVERGQWTSLSAAGPATWAAIAYSAVVASIAAQALYYGVVTRSDVSRVAPMMLMMPLWTVVIGVMLLGETMTGRDLLGAAATLLGIGLTAWPGRRSDGADRLAPSQGDET